VIRVVNPLGLHHRAADRFCRAAKKFRCSVTVWNGDLKADGKNIWDLIGLVVLPGTDVILEVAGFDATGAMESLTGILGSPGGEDYTI
jgi:phosphotransferase system HPr (HPr) family protein